jgi:uncharacterized protein
VRAVREMFSAGGLNLVPIAMIGLLGGVHCVGMCGGIVSALSVAAQPARKAFPVAVVSRAGTSALDGTLKVLAYNLGRISSYTMAGAIAGGVAGAAGYGIGTLSRISSFQIAGYWLANMMLIALGLYLMGAWNGLTRLEAVGQTLWRRIQPITRHFLPMDNAAKALALGGLWGWLPCGMVYSVLLTAMLTGSALSGALVMLAFGLGTLPNLLLIGLLGSRMQRWSRRRSVRIGAGLLVLVFGVLGLIRVANGLSLGWLDAICVTPHGAGSGR